MKQFRSATVSYDIAEFLGEGLNSVVYRAVRSDPGRHLNQSIALKILKSENSVDLWKKEFESLERVSSRHCVRLYGFDWVKGRPALVLEYVAGVSLRQLCLSGPVPIHMAAEVLAQIQRGLLDLADHGVCHGDLSPNNVMVDGSGCVKLLDFGWANTSHATVEFAAPELFAGAKPDLLSDQYSLGAIERLLMKTISPRLSSLREDRTFLEWKPDPLRQAELGNRVRDILEHQTMFNALATRSIQLARRSQPAVLHWMVGALLLFGPPRPQALPPKSAFLQVRNLAWARVVIDGVEAGYAPQDFAITANQDHRIELEAAEGRAAMTLHLRPGEIRRIQDLFRSDEPSK